MSKLSQLRKKVGYETGVPRCVNCIHFRKPFIKLTYDSKTIKVPAWCKKNDFKIEAGAVCNLYENDKGQGFLEGIPSN